MRKKSEYRYRKRSCSSSSSSNRSSNDSNGKCAVQKQSRQFVLDSVANGNSAVVTTTAVTAFEQSEPYYAAVTLVAIVCYLNGTHGEFVHDDNPAIKFNGDVTAERSLFELFRNDFWGLRMSDAASHKSYRPLTVLTFRLNYAITGPDPFWFHVVNILLHVIVTMLFMRVCSRIARLTGPFTTIAGLLFAVHPIHTEAVTGIVGRADLLAAMFFLLSLLFYHKHVKIMARKQQHHYGQQLLSMSLPSSNNLWISILLATLSTFAKETGFTIFFVNIVLFDFTKSAPYSTSSSTTSYCSSSSTCLFQYDIISSS